MIDIRSKQTLSILAALVFLISACLPVAALAEAGADSRDTSYVINSNITLTRPSATDVPSLTLPVGTQVELTVAIPNSPDMPEGIKYEWKFATGEGPHDISQYKNIQEASFGASQVRTLEFGTTKEMANDPWFLLCSVTDGDGTTNTDPVRINTFKPADPVLTGAVGNQPFTESVNLNQGTEFTLSAASYYPSGLTPSGQVTYVWERSDSPDAGFQAISGQQNSNTFVGKAPGADSSGGAKTEYYRYKVTFTPTATTQIVNPDMTSNIIAVTGANAPYGIYFKSPQGQPEAQSVAPGGRATLAVDVGKLDEKTQFTCLWQYATVNSATDVPADNAWQDISGSNFQRITTSELNAGYYCFRCIAATEAGQIVSPVFHVNVESTQFRGYTLSLDGTETQMPGNYVVTAPSGTTAALTVALNNQPTSASYQWQCRAGSGAWVVMDSGSVGSGVQSPTLTLPISDAINGYQYRCVVTNNHSYEVYGNTDRDPVVTISALSAGYPYESLVPVPRITSSVGGASSDIRASVGMLVTFTAQNASEPSIPSQYLSYQWESAPAANGSFSPIRGATSPEYVLEVKQDTPVAYYRCQIRNTASARGQEVASSPIRLQSLEPDGSVFFTTPTTAQELVVRPGDIVTLGSAARTDNGAPVNYQWQVARVSQQDTPFESVPNSAWTAITGVSTANYTTEPLKFGYFFYRCVATNSRDINKRASSLPFRVNVIPFQPVPVVVPAETTAEGGGYYSIRTGVAEGAALELSVSATIPTGERPIYQWMIWRDGAVSPVELSGQTSSTLRIPNITSSYNRARIYCRVTNSQVLAAQANSARWIVSVWDPDDIPRITTQPNNVTATYDPTNPSAYSAVISVTATGSTSAHLEKFYEQRWLEVDGSDKNPQNVSGENGTSSNESTSQTYSWDLAAPDQDWDPNGQYRVAVEKTPATARSASDQPELPPTAYSNSIFVNVTILGMPAIVTQPADRTAKVGEQASFEVAATVTPQSYPLAYRWQVSRDGGKTWTNCLSTDGTSSGRTFRTVTLTETMRLSDPDWSFRCVVSNAATGQSVTSDACVLIIEPGETPDDPQKPDDPSDPVKGQILAVSGSGLTVAANEVTGETATVRGINAEEFMKGLTATEGFHLLLAYADGKPVENMREPIGTGMIVQLVSDAAPADILETAVVILKGDVTGSGLVNIIQLTTMARDLNEVMPLQGAYLKAGDFNNNGDIDVADLVSEARILNGTTL